MRPPQGRLSQMELSSSWFLDAIREVQEKENAFSTDLEYEITCARNRENCRRLGMYQRVTLLLLTTFSLAWHQYYLCPQNPAERDYASELHQRVTDWLYNIDEDPEDAEDLEDPKEFEDSKEAEDPEDTTTA
ncbi:MAG: hypothetical protein Q9213_000734 [Squamulea squamosa]